MNHIRDLGRFITCCLGVLLILPWGLSTEPGDDGHGIGPGDPVEMRPTPEEPSPVPPSPSSSIEPFFTQVTSNGEGTGHLFQSRGSRLSAFFGTDGVDYVLHRPPPSRNDAVETFAMSFQQGSSTPVGLGLLDHRTNYITSANGEPVSSNHRNFERVLYPDVWEGIDVQFYFKEGTMKYDIIVHPGGDTASARLAYSDVTATRIVGPTGDLEIQVGGAVLTDTAPVAYQDVDGLPRPVGCVFEMHGSDTVGFRCSPYDTSVPLVIDPGMVFGTFVGGLSIDRASDLSFAMDSAIYVAGITIGADFPTTEDALDRELNGSADIFLLKMDANGTSILYSTFIGGEGYDNPRDLVLDDDGYVYLCGETRSPDFPVTTNAYCQTLQGRFDAFSLKLSLDGTTLLSSTLLGGDDHDSAASMALDGDGNRYITGMTRSSNFPTTSNAHDESFNGGDEAFLSVLDPQGTTLMRSTFIGGAGDDAGIAVALDASGRVFVTGETDSDDYPTSTDALDADLNGLDDAFLTVLTGDLTTVEYSTYLGGLRDDDGAAILIIDDAVYLTGAAGPGFPTSPQAYNRTGSSGADVFVLAMDTVDFDLTFSTYVGGNAPERGYAILVDDEGCPVVSGTTYSTDFPTTKNAFSERSAGTLDAFLFKMDPLGSDLLYSTMLGGRSIDEGYGLIVDEEGCYYLTGFTSSDDFPATAGTISPTLNGDDDIFVVRLDITPPTFLTDGTPTVATTGDLFEFNVSVLDNLDVANVTVEYWYQGMADHINVSLHRTGIGSPWTTEVIIPSGSVAPLHYRFSALDRVDNPNSTSVRTVAVLDNDGPTLVSTTPSFASTDDDLTFSVTVTDNIALDTVHVRYWFGGDEANAVDASMEGPDPVVDGGGTYTHGPVSIPSNSLVPLHYVLTGMDAAGNSASTDTTMVTVLDDDPPILVDDLTEGDPENGRPFTITVDVVDNIGIQDVVARYSFNDMSSVAGEMAPLETTGLGNGTYQLVITVPDGSRAVSYQVEVRDTSDNLFVSEAKNLTVADRSRPVVEGDHSDLEAVKGLTFHFNVSVSDNREVAGVYVVYRLGSGGTQNVSMDGYGRYTLDIAVPRDASGMLVYHIELHDASSNWNSSPEVYLDISNIPPELDTIPKWTVQEGVETVLDVSPYIHDPNDGPSSLSMTSSSPNVTVDGLLLVALFEDWVEGHTIQFTVSDGEDETTTDHEIEVVNVNDAPTIIAVVSPRDGAGYDHGERVVLDVDFADPDIATGQTVQVVWESDVSGEILRYTNLDDRAFSTSSLPSGEHRITVTVSDGEFSASETISITISDDGINISDYYPWFILVVVVVILVVGVTAYLRWRR